MNLSERHAELLAETESHRECCRCGLCGCRRTVEALVAADVRDLAGGDGEHGGPDA